MHDRFQGSFALWGGLFSLTDCTLIHLRNKEDYLNPIAAGFFTGGFLAIRGTDIPNFAKPVIELLLETQF